MRKSPIKNAVGSKNASGMIPFLCNNIPYHNCYIELFARSAQLYYHKKPAEFNYLNDIDSNIYRILKDDIVCSGRKSTVVANMCAVRFISEYGCLFGKDSFAFMDPPYLLDTRAGREYYEFEMTTQDHIKLLSTVQALDCYVMIAHPECQLYDSWLQFPAWRKVMFETCYHGKPYTECFYLNYSPPSLLHQYDYLGVDNIDRQRVKRKVQRLQSKVTALPAYEIHALLEGLVTSNCAAVQSYMSAYPGIVDNSDCICRV